MEKSGGYLDQRKTESVYSCTTVKCLHCNVRATRCDVGLKFIYRTSTNNQNDNVVCDFVIAYSTRAESLVLLLHQSAIFIGKIIIINRYILLPLFLT